MATVSSAAAKTISARTLQRHCTRMCTMLGPATPPETFLFRGNAYLAQDKPYFAVADYQNAARFLPLSGEHEARCEEAMRRLPGLMVGEYAASDAHLDTLVRPYLNTDAATIAHVTKEAAVEGGPFRFRAGAIATSAATSAWGTAPSPSPQSSSSAAAPSLGRGIFAVKDLPAGTVVMRRHAPLVTYGLRDGRCSNCNKVLPARVFPCTNDNCHEEYCSRPCREEARNVYHAKTCENMEFAGVELDLFSKLEAARASGNASEFNSAAAIMITARILSIAMQRHVIPSAMAEIRTLGGRIEFAPSVLGTETLELYWRFERALKFSTTISFEEFVSLLARVTANSFQDGEESISLYVPRSLFNHSCEGNVASEAGTGDLVTTKAVTSGDQLCLNYYPHLRTCGFAERTQELTRRGFYCQCERCLRQE